MFAVRGDEKAPLSKERAPFLPEFLKDLEQYILLSRDSRLWPNSGFRSLSKTQLSGDPPRVAMTCTVAMALKMTALQARFSHTRVQLNLNSRGFQSCNHETASRFVQ
jgi:hypothetical protein